MNSDKMRRQKKRNVSLPADRESTKQVIENTVPETVLPRKLSHEECSSTGNKREIVASTLPLHIPDTKDKCNGQESATDSNLDEESMETSEQSSAAEESGATTTTDQLSPELEEAPATHTKNFEVDRPQTATNPIMQSSETLLIDEGDLGNDDKEHDMDGLNTDLEKNDHEDDNDNEDISNTSLTAESTYRRSSVFWEVEKEEAAQSRKSAGLATYPGAVSLFPGQEEPPSFGNGDLQPKFAAAYGIAHASIPATDSNEQNGETDGYAMYDRDDYDSSLTVDSRISGRQHSHRMSGLPPPAPPIPGNEVCQDLIPGAVPVEGPEGGRIRMFNSRRSSNDSWAHVRASTTSSDLSITAVLVEDNTPVEHSRRRSFTFSEIVHASAVQNISVSKRQWLLMNYFVVIILVTVVGLAVGLSKRHGGSDDSFSEPPIVASSHPTPNPSLSPAANPYALNAKPTLSQVNERGFLRCGVPNKFGFSFWNETRGEREGFEVDLCRAIGAAIFGKNYKIETVVLSTGERFMALHEGLVDILIRTTTHTMERDIYQIDTGVGFTFSTPYLYDGLMFGGIPPYDACADKRLTTGECSGLKICVRDATTHLDILSELLPGSSIVPIQGILEIGLLGGECNAIAGESSEIGADIVKLAGYNGPYEVGTSVLSKEPLAMVTRDGDSEWSDFVNWVLGSMLYAEQQGITQRAAIALNQINVFGPKYADMFINAIGAVGNYGEIYRRHLAGSFPRQGLNLLNTGNTGLMYSHPFGSIEGKGPGPAEGGLINKIIGRGSLRCGISRRNGFGEYDGSEWSGLDADYCRALSASVFAGGQNKVDFIEVSDTDYVEDLFTGKLDVMSGVYRRIQQDVEGLGAASKKAVSFSVPYFFEGSLGVSRALATRQYDGQWSAFVYWVVSCTFYAEEKGITKSRPNQMPIVESIGSDFSRMFRDAILAVGNYGEMYSRNVEDVIPRNGRNMLNFDPVGPQHFPLPIY